MDIGSTYGLCERQFLFCHVRSSLEAQKQTGAATVQQEQEAMVTQCTYASNSLGFEIAYAKQAEQNGPARPSWG